MIKIICKCSEVYFADEQHIGKTIKCKNCGDILPIIKPAFETTGKFQESSKKGNKVVTIFWGVVISIVSISLFFIIYSSYKNHKNDKTTPNGELDSSFIKTKTLSPEEKFKQEKNKLISDGWTESNIKNGQLPDCYNFQPKKGRIENHFEVTVGGGTDIAVKVMNLETNKCFRYFFVNSGTTFTVDNTPEGKYYLKIAYGKNWLSKIIEGQCVGKFIRNPIYEKGVDTLDFYVKHLSDRVRINNYSLQLDVVSNNPSNSFNSNAISEKEFNQ